MTLQAANDTSQINKSGNKIMRFTIKAKLALAFGVIIALFAAACVGFYVLAWAVWTLPRPM